MIETDVAVSSGMKIVCSRDELGSKLAVAARAVSTRTAVQILSGILLRAEAGELHIAATDMELSVRTSFEAQVEGEGSVVVPGRLLLDIARGLPEAEVSIEHREDEGLVRITCGPSNYRLNTYSAADFPRLPTIEGAQIYAVERTRLLDAVTRVQRSASRDESRPVLTGILLRFESGRLVAAATDSYRLSVRETPIDADVPELEAIIPARALVELSRIAPGEGQLELGIQENQVLFGVDGIWLATRRIDGQFPNYKQLLPESFEHELTLPRVELLEVVRRVSVLAQRNSPLRLRFAEGELTVSARTQDVGEASESLPVGYTGEPLEIGFNADFLRDGLESVTGDEFVLNLISPLRPAVMISPDDEFTYLIMPIRLAG
jgi:DNA polymerase III subunit beta